MIQQRKKDYLQRLIEEFFSRFEELLRKEDDLKVSEKREILNDGFAFFSTHFGVKQSDTLEILGNKIADTELLEQYARLLLLKYEIVDIKDIVQLHVALDIIIYIEAIDKTYSWNRTVLKEDLLRLLNE